MKEIDLQIGFSTGMQLDVSKLYAPPPAGQNQVLLGAMNVQELREEIEIARRNGAQVVWAALEVEQAMEHIISDHMFFPMGIMPPRDFFNRHILTSSFFGFAPKKELVREIVNKRGLLDAKEKNTLPGHLKKVMDRRNAFAHGKITGMQDQGCFLEYFSGGQKEVLLTDKFWEELTTAFLGAKALLKKARSELLKQYVASVSVPAAFDSGAGI